MKRESEALAGLGRFSEPSLFILISLAGGPKHGYAMMEDIARLTQTQIGPGTLYGALSRLEEQGLIEALPPEERRRPYRLTERGVAVLSQTLATLRDLATVGQERLARA